MLSLPSTASVMSLPGGRSRRRTARCLQCPAIGHGGSIGIGIGTCTFYLPYEVYSDSGMTSAYPTSGSTGVTLPGAGTAFPLPVFGRINKTNPAAMASGTYTDVLQVTLSW